MAKKRHRGIDRKNAEGYSDPTPYEALCNIEEEEGPLNDIAKAFKATTESIQSLAERFNKATNDKE